MADETTQETSTTPPTQTPEPVKPEGPAQERPQEPTAATDVNALPAWAQEMIRELRSEAAERRREAKRIQTEAEKAEQERLVKQGEFKSAYEKVVAELEPLKTRIDRADALEGWMKETVKKRVEALPEQFRGMVPHYDDPLQTLQWLDKNAGVLVPPRAPDLDPGQRGTVGTPALSAEESAMAKRFGLTPEQYAKSKAQMTKA